MPLSTYLPLNFIWRVVERPVPIKQEIDITQWSAHKSSIKWKVRWEIVTSPNMERISESLNKPCMAKLIREAKSFSPDNTTLFFSPHNFVIGSGKMLWDSYPQSRNNRETSVSLSKVCQDTRNHLCHYSIWGWQKLRKLKRIWSGRIWK